MRSLVVYSIARSSKVKNLPRWTYFGSIPKVGAIISPMERNTVQSSFAEIGAVWYSSVQ